MYRLTPKHTEKTNRRLMRCKQS